MGTIEDMDSRSSVKIKWNCTDSTILNQSLAIMMLYPNGTKEGKPGKAVSNNKVKICLWGKLYDYERLVWYYSIITGFGVRSPQYLCAVVDGELVTGIPKEMLLLTGQDRPYKNFPKVIVPNLRGRLVEGCNVEFRTFIAT